MAIRLIPSEIFSNERKRRRYNGKRQICELVSASLLPSKPVAAEFPGSAQDWSPPGYGAGLLTRNERLE
jgi:hypothetical protein